SPSSAAAPFIVRSETGDRLTYSDFLRRVDSLSSYLAGFLSKSDVAFVVAPPSFVVPVLYFALMSINVVVSPSNHLSSPAELEHQIRLCHPAVIFTTAEISTKIPSRLPKILVDSSEFLSRLDSDADFLTAGEITDVDPSDAAAIFYSSGTTGKVKGVVLSHRNLIAYVASELEFRSCIDRERGSANSHGVTLFTLPTFHAFGFLFLCTAAAGGDCLVTLEKNDLEKMVSAVERYRVTFIPMTPPSLVALSKSDVVKKYDLSSLQSILCGAAPLSEEVFKQFTATFPHVEIFQSYGMTESPGGSRSMTKEETRRHDTVGKLWPFAEAKIISGENGKSSLPPGQPGELWLRGPTVMKGYAGDEAATAATLDSERWLKTGDLCYFDSDGFLFVVDRLKEFIKCKAYQVAPAELENLLLSIPQVADAAVIPYPDEEAGQIPMAYIVTRPNANISAPQIMNFIAKQVSPCKKIRRIAFINAIPKSPQGKILRRILVKHALSSS
ncbi:acyl:coa ligase, partial [Genlisea aurea]